MNRSTNVDAKAVRGATPMIIAARMHVANMIEELVEANANVNETDDSGKIFCYFFIVDINIVTTCC